MSTSAERKRRWRTNPLNRKQEANAHRARRSDPLARLQETQRDTFRHAADQLARDKQRAEELY